MKNLQRYPLPRVGIALILGIVFGDYFIHVPPWIWLACASVSVVVSIWMERYSSSLLILCATFFLGAWLVGNEECRMKNEESFDWKPMAQANSSFFFLHSSFSFQGVIASKPIVKGKVTQFDLLVVSKGKPFKLRASVLRDTLSDKEKALALGKGIMAHSRIKPIENHHSSLGFDYARWAQVHGYAGQTFISRDGWRPCVVSLSSLSWFQRTRLAAMQWREQIIRRMPSSADGSPSRSIIVAMTLGEKGTLSQATKELYSDTGASHVLALSGLHLSILFGILLFTASSRKRGVIRPSFLLTTVWAYVVLTGMSPSIIRSAVMLSVYGIMASSYRHTTSLNTLTFAAIVMLMANPLTLWDVGFQMSFLSVAAIISVLQWLGHRGINFHSLVGKMATVFLVIPIAAQLATFPLIMYYFGSFPCLFLITNFIVIPMAYIVLYGMVVWLILLPLPSISAFVFHIIEQVVEWGNTSLSSIAALPCSSITNIHVTPLEVCLIYILIITILAIVHRLTKAHLQARFLLINHIE
ncbi:MAG: ComEC/Rec2 family competence protein [Prevotella sp.]|nr:ComEC/Rec2 family competence protein [Prevotella sp.]MBQ6211063.1 ComEC/Rec2 family competence protein [Prevotella sp.]